MSLAAAIHDHLGRHGGTIVIAREPDKHVLGCPVMRCYVVRSVCPGPRVERCEVSENAPTEFVDASLEAALLRLVGPSRWSGSARVWSKAPEAQP